MQSCPLRFPLLSSPWHGQMRRRKSHRRSPQAPLRITAPCLILACRTTFNGAPLPEEPPVTSPVAPLYLWMKWPVCSGHSPIPPPWPIKGAPSLPQHSPHSSIPPRHPRMLSLFLVRARRRRRPADHCPGHRVLPATLLSSPSSALSLPSLSPIRVEVRKMAPGHWIPF
jgi:hypothetical protein